MIKFGTDGWRAIIAKDFTYENLSYVALGTARYLKKNSFSDKGPSVVIGYDTRFMSAEFAAEVACILAWQGITVHLTDDISTTPHVSYHTKQKSADLGVVITASHNPAEYSGYKVKGNFGGPATPEQVAEIEKEVNKVVARPPQFKHKDLDFYIESKQVRIFDPKESYNRYLKKKIDIKGIQESGLKIIYDPMHGAGIDNITHILDSENVDEIHFDHNPGFGNVDHPEPIANCLTELMDIIKAGGYDVGFATDGDADRLGAVDHEGNFVDSHKVYMILLKYLYEQKRKRGKVVKTVSLTSMVDMYCEDKGIDLIKTPVGFKYIAKKMVEEKVIIGGEESGGLSTALHIPERDGLFNMLLLLDVMVNRKMSLKELVEELDDQFGPHVYNRVDKKMSEKEKDQILKACSKKPQQLGRFKVESIDMTDGYKFFVDNGWLLIRASGTEPLIRFYAEADSMNKVNELIEEGMNLK